jgi:hypothetical protein
MIQIILFFTSLFYLLDLFLTSLNFNGTYYLNHFFVNTYVTYLTFNDFINTYVDFNNIKNYDMNYYAVHVIYSLHYYHIIYYYNKLKFDDWLHHITMVFIALPLGTIVNSGTLLGNSLFFINGLPGGINYLLLFLQRNNFIKKNLQKNINSYLNLWIRMPGCVGHGILGFVYLYNNLDKYQFFYGIVACILTFWNGIYYMDMVVRDYAIQPYKN